MTPTELAYLGDVFGLFGWLIVIILAAIVSGVTTSYRWCRRLLRHLFSR